MKANDRQMHQNSNQFDKYMCRVELPRVSWNTHILHTDLDTSLKDKII